MALAGVMTGMPLVCMSIVASAFQYGWRPTLIPVTTMLTSVTRRPGWSASGARRAQQYLGDIEHLDAVGCLPLLLCHADTVGQHDDAVRAGGRDDVRLQR